MKIARDIMTTDIKSIGSGEELKNTVKVFLEFGTHYAPVVTPIGEVLGIFSEFGLVKASLRHYLDQENHEKIINHKDLLEEAVCVYEDASLDEVVKAMMKSVTRRVLVTSVSGKLTGIISPKDILFCLQGEAEKTYNLRKELEKAQSHAKSLDSKIKGLEASLKIYQNLVQDSPNMIHSADKDGKIIMANKKIHETLGYDEGELLGKYISVIYPKSVMSEALDGLKKIQEEGYHHSTYTTMVKKDGSKIRVDLASSALRDSQGQFLSTITISRVINSEALLRALHGIQN